MMVDVAHTARTAMMMVLERLILKLLWMSGTRGFPREVVYLLQYSFNDKGRSVTLLGGGEL